jgi:hypothetical protein
MSRSPKRRSASPVRSPRRAAARDAERAAAAAQAAALARQLAEEARRLAEDEIEAADEDTLYPKQLRIGEDDTLEEMQEKLMTFMDYQESTSTEFAEATRAWRTASGRSRKLLTRAERSAAEVGNMMRMINEGRKRNWEQGTARQRWNYLRKKQSFRGAVAQTRRALGLEAQDDDADVAAETDRRSPSRSPRAALRSPKRAEPTFEESRRFGINPSLGIARARTLPAGDRPSSPVRRVSSLEPGGTPTDARWDAPWRRGV